MARWACRDRLVAAIEKNVQKLGLMAKRLRSIQNGDLFQFKLLVLDNGRLRVHNTLLVEVVNLEISGKGQATHHYVPIGGWVVVRCLALEEEAGMIGSGIPFRRGELDGSSFEYFSVSDLMKWRRVPRDHLPLFVSWRYKSKRFFKLLEAL